MRTSQALWRRCADSGDIYLSSYEGWYNEREEMFVAESEAEAMGFKDPGNGLPLKRVKEESYFFRMSRFCARLISLIEESVEFIQPESHRQLILHRLKKEGLRDLSISRTSFSWGIPVPEGFDPKHVMVSGDDLLFQLSYSLSHSTSGSTHCRTTSLECMPWTRRDTRWPDSGPLKSTSSARTSCGSTA